MALIKSRLKGESNGWEGDTILQLENGQVWAQVQYYYRYRYKYRPWVYINGNRATIEGIDKAVRVERLR